MPKIKTSSLNQRISFYRLENTTDTSYGNVPVPVAYWSDTYASVKDVKSRRVTDGGNYIIEDAFEFNLRFRDDKEVKVTDIIKYRRKGYTVLSVYPDDIYKENLRVIAITNGIDFDDETT